MRANYKTRTINGVRFQPIQFKIITALLASRNGISANDLFDYIYSDNPNGGPDTGPVCLNTPIFYANCLLQFLNLRIKSSNSIKRLEPIQ